VKKAFLFILITVLILSSYATQPEQKSMSQVENDLAAQLEGRDFDEFLEVSYRELMLREDPQGVIFYGLAEEYGLEEVTLTNVSDAYLEETFRMYGIVLEILREYDRDELTPDRQISYDV
jgi:hypothetical protein